MRLISLGQAGDRRAQQSSFSRPRSGQERSSPIPPGPSPPVSAAAGAGAGPGSSGASPAQPCPCAATLCGGSWAASVLGREKHSVPRGLGSLVSGHRPSALNLAASTPSYGYMAWLGGMEPLGTDERLNYSRHRQSWLQPLADPQDLFKGEKEEEKERKRRTGHHRPREVQQSTLWSQTAEGQGQGQRRGGS